MALRARVDRIGRMIAIKSKRSTKLFASLVVTGALALTMAASPAHANGHMRDQGERIMIGIDRAKVLRLSAPAKTIVIGNPSIADATVYDQTTIILTGKSFGETNVIIIDADGKIVHEKSLRVGAPDDVLVVNRGANQFTYSCSPNCTRTLRIGDEKDAFQETLEQAAAIKGLNQGGTSE